MKFKADNLAVEFDAAYYKLKWILTWLDAWAKEHCGKEITLTCVRRTRKETLACYAGVVNPVTKEPYRPDEVPPSCHETDPCRAADVRSTDFTEEQCVKIVDTINREWVYDLTRPNKAVCVYHDVAGAHFHIQAHLRTMRAT